MVVNSNSTSNESIKLYATLDKHCHVDKAEPDPVRVVPEQRSINTETAWDGTTLSAFYSNHRKTPIYSV